MRKLLFIFSVLLFFGVTTKVEAAELNCDVAPPGAEPLNTHTEARFRRYLSRSSEARNLNDEEQQRFEYLQWEKECEQQARRNRRLQQRRQSISDRLRVNEETDTSVPQAAFDPYGPGSEPLAPSRESRIARYVKNDNCESVSFAEEDFVRCIYLLRQQDALSAQAIANRRTARRDRTASTRVTSRKISTTLTNKSAARSVFSADKSPSDAEEFDVSGPGSEPLGSGEENRIQRYVENGQCSRLSRRADWMERCDYLVQYRENQRKISASKSRTRVTNQDSSSRVFRRGVDSTYRRSISNTTSVLKLRAAAGFRGRPRTVQQAQEGYQAPVTVDGD